MYPGLPSRLEREIKQLYLARVLKGNTEKLSVRWEGVWSGWSSMTELEGIASLDNLLGGPGCVGGALCTERKPVPLCTKASLCMEGVSHLVLKALCHTWYYVTLGTQISMSHLETSTKSSLIPLSTKSMESLVLKTQCMERKLLYLYEKPSSENSMYGEKASVFV